MAQQDESAEKSHEPSPRKLEEARKKGEIPRAPDLLTGMAYLGMLLSALVLGPASISQFADGLMPFIEHPDMLEVLFFEDGAQGPAGGVLLEGLPPSLVFLAVPGLFVLLTLLATRGLLFTPSKLVPKFSRISPIENAKNKFGRRGLFEFFKSFSKLLFYSLCLGLFLTGQIDLILASIRGSAGQAVIIMSELIVDFLTIVVVIAIVMGGIDFLWQRADHMRRNRMSQKELRDEFKEAEGDPMLKQQRRQRAQEIAMSQIIAEVPKADVVIVNPTHYAVALKWSKLPGSAPVCVAKGVDEVALRIRKIAEEAEVPIHSDPPTARALFATTDIGQEIDPDNYRPVAAAIRFAEDMRAKARKKGW